MSPARAPPRAPYVQGSGKDVTVPPERNQTIGDMNTRRNAVDNFVFEAEAEFFAHFRICGATYPCKKMHVRETLVLSLCR